MSTVARSTETLYKATMKAKHLRTQEEIVAAFGGQTRMAHWFGISPQAVCNWFGLPKKAAAAPTGIPNGYQYRVHLWAVAHGYVIDPEAFGLGRDGRPLGAPSAKAA